MKLKELHKCKKCGKDTTNPKFCSQKCAISFHNNEDNPMKRPEVRAKVAEALSGERNSRYRVPRSEEEKRKISETLKQTYKDKPELLEAMSKRQKGKPSWNKGLTKETDPRLAATGESIRLAKQDKPAWNKGLTKETDERVRINAEHIAETARLSSPREISEETRRKLSEANKGRKLSEYHIRRLSEANSGDNNAMKRPEVKEKHLAACRDPERCAKISAAMKDHNPMFDKDTVLKSVSNHIGPSQYNGNYFYHPDGRRIWMRSSYETRVASILTNELINWLYEIPLDLGSKLYFVDFYLPESNIYIEVKGWMSPSDKAKMKLCYKLFPDIELYILYLDNINKLEYNLQNNNKIGISLKEQVMLWELE